MACSGTLLTSLGSTTPVRLSFRQCGMICASNLTGCAGLVNPQAVNEPGFDVFTDNKRSVLHMTHSQSNAPSRSLPSAQCSYVLRRSSPVPRTSADGFPLGQQHHLDSRQGHDREARQRARLLRVWREHHCCALAQGAHQVRFLFPLLHKRLVREYERSR